MGIQESQGVASHLPPSVTTMRKKVISVARPPTQKKKAQGDKKMSEVAMGREFLELAIEIEKNGRFFYETVARQDRDKEVQDVFAQLAAREKEHENTYREMLNRLGGYRPR